MLFKNRKSGNVLSTSDATVIALMQKSDLYEEVKAEAAVKAASASEKKKPSKAKPVDSQ